MDQDCSRYPALRLAAREPDCCAPACRKTQAERVVVALLLGALLIIFLTVILSLVYLRETTSQAAGLVLSPGQDPQGRRWAAANNIRTKVANNSPPPGPETCQVPGCWAVARRISSWSEPRADPCSSLHKLACGRWPAGEPDSVSVMDDRQAAVDSRLRDLALALPPTSPLAPLARLLRSCADTPAIQERGFQPAIEFLHKKFGAHLSPDSQDQGDLTAVIADILAYSGTALFDLGLDIDPRDNNRLLAVVSLPPARPPLGRAPDRTARSSGAVTSSRAVFREVQAEAAARRIGRLFSLVENYKILDNYSQPFRQSTAEEIVGFVAALTKLVPTREEERMEVAANRVYNTYNIAELQSSFRYIDWKKLMRALFGEGIDNSSLFLVHFPAFLRQLDRLVSLFGVRVARLSLVVLFAQDMLEERVRARPARWRQCSALGQALLPGPAAHLFLTSYSAAARRGLVARAMDVSEAVRREAMRQVERTGWLSRQTRSKVLQKVATMRSLAEPPQYFLNLTAVTVDLPSLGISSTEFFTNVLTLSRYQRTALYRSLAAGVDSSLFPWTRVASPLAVTAFRIRQFNTVVLPFGLLAQTLAGGEGLPGYLDSAALAMVVGHEVAHGLDTAGRGFDLQGRLQQVWDAASLARYQQKAACLARERWPPRTVLHRGRRVTLERDREATFDEDLSDMQALELARGAAWPAEGEPALPGLNFTREQAFYINIAQSFCGRLDPLGEILASSLSPHSARPERTDRMMIHSHNFAEAFRCRLGTRMDPVSKCSRLFG